MDSQSKKQFDDDGIIMPLPSDGSNNSKSSTDPAVEFIRRKVNSAYSNEPGVEEEMVDMAVSGQPQNLSKHQKYLFDLTNSGKSLAEIQVDWHDYYAALPDTEKHQVWREYSEAQARAFGNEQARPILEPKSVLKSSPTGKTTHRKTPSPRSSQNFKDLKDSVIPDSISRKKPGTATHIQSLLFGVGVGSIVVFVFLFSFFNERFIAPFIQPSRNITATPIISDGQEISASPRIIIPKINVGIPVVYDSQTTDEEAIQKALEGGVVHYADTALPGQNGNLVIVGHSSNNIFNKGKYKFAFVLLSRLDKGDTFYLDKDSKRYTYQIFDKKIVKPTDVAVLGNASGKAAVASLITCDPPGTSANRLVVVGEQINPDPSSNLAKSTNTIAETKTAIVPGNAPTLWAHIWSVLSR